MSQNVSIKMWRGQQGVNRKHTLPNSCQLNCCFSWSVLFFALKVNASVQTSSVEKLPVWFVVRSACISSLALVSLALYSPYVRVNLPRTLVDSIILTLLVWGGEGAGNSELALPPSGSRIGRLNLRKIVDLSKVTAQCSVKHVFMWRSY